MPELEGRARSVWKKTQKTVELPKILPHPGRKLEKDRAALGAQALG